MTLVEIKTAVRAGKAVHWAHEGYRVCLHHFKDGREQWLITCTSNQSSIGLTWRDGMTMNGSPDQFFIAE
jgi:hypothetical protein